MSEAQTSMAYRLISDFALSVTGEPQGLTPAELRRAWLARHGGQPSRRAHARLSEDLLIRLLPRRVCTVTGRRVGPYVPATVGIEPW